jgi:hypothetical protein
MAAKAEITRIDRGKESIFGVDKVCFNEKLPVFDY